MLTVLRCRYIGLGLAISSSFLIGLSRSPRFRLSTVTIGVFTNGLFDRNEFCYHEEGIYRATWLPHTRLRS